jgi:hypothetical protein
MGWIQYRDLLHPTLRNTGILNNLTVSHVVPVVPALYMLTRVASGTR